MTSVPHEVKRRKSRHTCRAETGSASPGRSRSVTFQPLSFRSHATNAPTARGSDSSTAVFVSPYRPYGFGTGRATMAGWPASSSRCGASGTYPAWRAARSSVIAGANAAFTRFWIHGTARKLVVR